MICSSWEILVCFSHAQGNFGALWMKQVLSRYHSVYVYVGNVLGTYIVRAIKLHRINRKVMWRAFKEEKWVKVLSRKSQVNRNPGELFVTVVIILKCVLNKWFGRVWITLIWLAVGTVMDTVIVITELHKIRGNRGITQKKVVTYKLQSYVWPS